MQFFTLSIDFTTFISYFTDLIMNFGLNMQVPQAKQ